MLNEGQLLRDRYRIVRELGHGGFGRVYLAEEFERSAGDIPGQASLVLPLDDDAVLRHVAIKVFSNRDPLKKDFIAELRALCRLSHPNIVSIFDYQPEDPAFIVMEYVPGRDLDSILRESGPFPLLRALQIAHFIGEALAHAHSAHVLHRDVKPSNVILSDRGPAKLLDFGLARNAEVLGAASTQLGTPGFVAPELLDPDRFPYPVGVAADVYGFGCFLHALLVGESPFAGHTPVQTLRHQLEGRREAVDGLHPLVAGLIQDATALTPSERFPSMPPLLERLRRIEQQLRNKSGDRASLHAELNQRRVDIVDAQIGSVDSFRHPVRGRGIKFEAFVNAEAEPVRGFAYEPSTTTQRRGSLFESLSGLWPGAEVSLLGSVVVDSPSKGPFLSGDANTLAVVEPHFLVSTTNIVRARGVQGEDCPTRFFVDLRERSSFSRPLLFGRIVHQLLDRLVADNPIEPDFEAHYAAVLRSCRMDAVAAGFRDTDMGPFLDSVRPSYEWLVRFVSKNLRGANSSVEVTRFSGHYGLEGRIDLAALGPSHVELLELKSGKRQTVEHSDQVRCYSLLWAHVSKSLGRELRPRLIYSQVGQEVGFGRVDHDRDRKLLTTRNGIVTAHFRLAQRANADNLPHYEEFPDRCRDSACRFRTKACSEQTKILGYGDHVDLARSVSERGAWFDFDPTLVAAARVYYHHFVTLIEREYVAASREMGEFTRASGVLRRIEEESAIGGITISEWDPGAGALRLSGAALQQLNPGTDIVVHRGDPQTDATFTGRVSSVDAAGLVLATPAAGFCAELPKDDWIVERQRTRIGYRESNRALYQLIRSRNSEALRAILFGAEVQAVHLDPRSLRELDDLNDAQRTAVALALTETRPVLIHGPPGTGKTTVIARIVTAMVKRGQRVLVAAGTNTAVDNILEQLVAGDVDFLRLGRLASNSPLRRQPGFKPARCVEADLGRAETRLDALAERLATVPVVAGTAHKCVSSPVISFLQRDAVHAPFDLAIVDEATQLTEPLTLAPINIAARFVLVGDEKQLPPVISADECRTANVVGELDEQQHELGLRGLDHTLFERLAGRVPEATLSVQYRMNSQVQDLANRLYYDGQLSPDDSVAERRLDLDVDALDATPPAIRARLDPQRSIVWETLRTERRTDRSNDAEVEEIASTVFHLLRAEPTFADQIGVISPFRKQCFAIRAALRERLGDETASLIEVDTVERFQGRQKEVMFVSLVADSWSDFVMDDRRLNVAFTRARSKLIVFGPGQLWYRYRMASGKIQQ